MENIRDDQEIKITDRNGKEFTARASHVEDRGKHAFVITTDKEHISNLQNTRGEITAKLKEEHGIKHNADLNYVERHPDGPLWKVNVDHIGPGPGLKGEPEKEKNLGKWMDEDHVKEMLGPTKMPDMERAQRLSQEQQAEQTQQMRDVPLSNAGKQSSRDMHQAEKQQEQKQQQKMKM